MAQKRAMFPWCNIQTVWAALMYRYSICVCSTWLLVLKQLLRAPLKVCVACCRCKRHTCKVEVVLWLNAKISCSWCLFCQPFLNLYACVYLDIHGKGFVQTAVQLLQHLDYRIRSCKCLHHQQLQGLDLQVKADTLVKAVPSCILPYMRCLLQKAQIDC